MQKLKLLLTLCVMLLLPALVQAQQTTVTGSIVDDAGDVITGVSILEVGTSNGTITNADGEYTISLTSEDAVLRFGFLGYKTQEVSVNGQSFINVVMIPDLKALEELIVVGYGTQRKSDITGSVSSISKDRLAAVASTNVLQSVQGSSPGVYIKRSSGSPDSQPDIRIRGINSIKASSTPLIVVDGIPFSSGSLNDISPSDIASMEVLKDASSSAIYGSRAANGVLLITTKRGTNEKATIEFNGSLQLQTIANKPDLMDGEEYLAFKQAAYENAGKAFGVEDVLDKNELESYNANNETDWLDELTRTAVTQNYQLSIRGGNERLKYYVSGNYTDQEGIVINSGYERMSIRNNFDFKVNDWLSVGNRMQITNSDVRSAEFGSGSEAAYRLSPWAKLKEDDGSYTVYPMSFSNYYSNVIADNMLKEEEDKRTRLFNNAFVKVDFPFLKGLSYKLNFGLDMNYRTRGEYWPSGTAESEVTLDDPNASPVFGDASTYSRRRRSWTLENIFDYTKQINKDNRISVTAMTSAQDYTNSEFNAGAEGFISDDFLWHNLQSGVKPAQSTSTYSEWTLLSAMGRINYNLMDKYLLTLTGRSDGYSAFAENNKWSFFPSVGLGWNIANESFMSDFSTINAMKLRFSYGQSGNQAISAYSSLAHLDGGLGYVFGQSSANGVSPSSLANPNLTWETTTATNIALDFGILNSRISGSLEFYETITDDLLMNRSIPSMAGVDQINDNIGSVKNRGVDIDLNTINVSTSNFSWQTSFNLSTFKDQIESLYGDDEDDVGNEWFIGERINVYYTQDADGIWQTDDDIAGYLFNTPATQLPSPGQAKLVDQGRDPADQSSINEGERDGVINDEDRTIIGSPDPTLLMGMTNTFTYKNVSLSFFVHSVHGNIRSVDIEEIGNYNTYSHEYWTEENRSNKYVAPDNSGSTKKGSLYYYDASFVRLKDVTLTYRFSEHVLNKAKINGLELSLNLRDIYTLTTFPGDDPEVGSNNTYPVPMSVLFGLRLTL